MAEWLIGHRTLCSSLFALAWLWGRSSAVSLSEFCFLVAFRVPLCFSLPYQQDP